MPFDRHRVIFEYSAAMNMKSWVRRRRYFKWSLYFCDCLHGANGIEMTLSYSDIPLMKSLTPLARAAALIVLALCTYAFLLGNGVFKKEFNNEPIAWYFLAKGIFCSLSLIVSSRALDVLLERLNPPKS